MGKYSFSRALRCVEGSVNGPSNKAERLALAAVIAPGIRETESEARGRRVARLGSDGRVVGYTDVAEFRKSILRRAEIEIGVVGNIRPKRSVCTQCGGIIQVPQTGSVPTLCKGCKPCLGCGGPTSGKKLCSGCTSNKKKPPILCWVCNTALPRSARESRRLETRAAPPKHRSCRPGASPDHRCHFCNVQISDDSARHQLARATMLMCKPCASQARRKPEVRCVGCAGPVNKNTATKARNECRNATCRKCVKAWGCAR